MLVRLLKEKRELSNLTKYRIQQLTGIRRDALAAIEEGKEVSVETVLKYVFFWHGKGIEIFSELFTGLEEMGKIQKMTNDLAVEELAMKRKDVVAVSEAKIIDDEARGGEDYGEAEEFEFEEAIYCWERGFTLSEQEQIIIIRHGKCPCCGSEVSKNRKKGYIGHKKFREDCEYFAYGELSDPRILDKYKKGVTPLKSSEK